MKPVRIFRHVGCIGPGYLGTFLERNNIPYEIICIDEGVAVPRKLDDISGLVFMGGSMNVTDPLDWIREEKELIKNAFEKDIPVLGICLGAQLLSSALGAEITHDPKMEIGWHAIKPVTDIPGNEWLKDLPDEFIPFHWHADSFSIPEDATVLFHSQCRQNQVYVLNKCMAIQFHPEMTIEMVKEWVALFGSDLEQDHPCTQPADEILLNLEQKITALQNGADIFFNKWIKGLIRN